MQVYKDYLCAQFQNLLSQNKNSCSGFRIMYHLHVIMLVLPSHTDFTVNCLDLMPFYLKLFEIQTNILQENGLFLSKNVDTGNDIQFVKTLEERFMNVVFVVSSFWLIEFPLIESRTQIMCEEITFFSSIPHSIHKNKQKICFFYVMKTPIFCPSMQIGL